MMAMVECSGALTVTRALPDIDPWHLGPAANLFGAFFRYTEEEGHRALIARDIRPIESYIKLCRLKVAKSICIAVIDNG